jgi:class 3 adenylate cyclase
VLGDVANTTARLASQAGVGEILVSEETLHAAGLNLDGCESRQLQLKGSKQPVMVQVISVSGCGK